jgi:flagellar biosynthesis chaperone FliJ
MFRTRLDTVVQVKERAEEKAAQEVARAETAVRGAQARLDAARERALADFRARHDVAHWETQELAQHRALSEEKRAQHEVELARRRALEVRVEYKRAHQSAEVVRRVADARREEGRREEGRVESKQLDEVASQLFVRRSA